MQLSPEEHVKTQLTIQKWVDSSISKTVNAPRGYSVRQVEKIYEMLYDGKAKGGTVYVDGSRDSQVLSLTSVDNAPAVQLHLAIDMNLIADSKDVQTRSEPTTIAKLEREAVAGNLRGDRLDRAIGINVGDNCPECKEGIIADIGGCNTCNNCGIQ